LASGQAIPFTDLCRRFGVSRKTGYKWLERFDRDGHAGLIDRSRRPRHSPARTPPDVERAVLRVRDAHPAWGGRKIRRVLLNRGHPAVPAASTITMILQRHGLISDQSSRQHQSWQRFEHPRPNDLWQMDFKGHFATQNGRCHPLTVLDDHSRYCIGLRACTHERADTVETELIGMFRRYGLPRRMLMDNGAPWGSDWTHPWTPLTVWLLRLGIRVTHGRPYHPQTQGKDERFHRTLVAELLQDRVFDHVPACQAAFDRWRHVYNHDRPHEALQLETPATRYTPSARPYPDPLPPLEYGPGDVIRRVQDGGVVHFHGQVFRVGRAFRGNRVALRPICADGVWHVYFSTTPIAKVNLNEGTSQGLPGGTSSAGSPEPPPWASFPSRQEQKPVRSDVN
jgi:transposase InsO family protein